MHAVLVLKGEYCVIELYKNTKFTVADVFNFFDGEESWDALTHQI